MATWHFFWILKLAFQKYFTSHREQKLSIERKEVRMKKFIGILIFVCLVIALGCSREGVNNFSLRKTDALVYLPNENSKPVHFNPGSEPKGFNGIKWETALSALQGMKHTRTDRSYGGIEFYLKEGDAFKLGNGKALPFEYGFWKGKFYVGMVMTKGVTDWNALREAVFHEFGEGAKSFSNREEYLWLGKNSVMALRYSEFSKMGIFYIRSDSMTKQMEDYRAEVK